MDERRGTECPRARQQRLAGNNDLPDGVREHIGIRSPAHQESASARPRTHGRRRGEPLRLRHVALRHLVAALSGKGRLHRGRRRRPRGTARMRAASAGRQPSTDRNGRSNPMRTHLPSALVPGHSVRAIVSLTIVTRAPASSAAVKAAGTQTSPPSGAAACRRGLAGRHVRGPYGRRHDAAVWEEPENGCGGNARQRAHPVHGCREEVVLLGWRRRGRGERDNQHVGQGIPKSWWARL